VSISNLISAIIIIESNGNDMAMGDHGKARGPLQIHRAVVEDVNRFNGTHYTWNGMTNRAAARKVCELYLQHYGKGRSMQDAARIWNGGPTGHTKSATKPYWTKIERNLNTKN
jgi:hypothetical protein